MQAAVDGAAFEAEESLRECESDADCVAAEWLVECPRGQFRRCDFACADARREEAEARFDEAAADVCAALEGPCESATWTARRAAPGVWTGGAAPSSSDSDG